MRYFFTRREPEPSRILLVESGSRSLLEGIIGAIRENYNYTIPIDVVTCYTGFPKGFSPDTTTVYQVNDYRDRAGRSKLYRELKPHFNVFYDDGGAVGRRYRRQDEIGTPYCFTIDGQTLQDQTVTLRDRDTTQQRRVPLQGVAEELRRKLRP